MQFMEELIKTGDQAQFNPPLDGGALFPPVPVLVPVNGTGTHSVMNMKGCIEGDEKKVKMSPVGYVAPPYVIPGTGMIFIDKLGSDQLSKKTTCKNKKASRK